MDAFTIKDLENLTGIRAHTIRIWEQRYSFIKPQRTETNIRYYSSNELKKILNIALLNKYGYKVSHIDRMTEEDVKEKILSLTNSSAQQERIVNELIHFMVDLNMDEFERVLDNYILARGIEKAILQIIFPFMERIGILWMTNHINPAQEHLVSNIIRQKIIVGIEGVSNPIKVNKSFLLFLPENEYHEMGLLFLYYLLKSRGIQVIYLGTNIPMEDVAYVVNLKKPDYLYTHLTTVSSSFSVEKFVNSINKYFKGYPMIMSGQFSQIAQKKIPQSIRVMKSLSEVMELITEIH